VWTLLDKEYPLADVYDYANELRSDYADFGLLKKPEIFRRGEKSIKIRFRTLCGCPVAIRDVRITIVFGISIRSVKCNG